MKRLTTAFTLILVASTLQPSGAAPVKITDVRVAMDDGVTLATDVYIPTGPDADGDGRYPCVVEVTPYRKELRAAEGSGYLPDQGIALIEVDARGTGGSGGEYDIVFSVREQADSAAMVEWAANDARKGDGSLLCEKTVGMYGGSYSGIIQYLVASLPPTRQGDVPAAPPHLAAIAPQRAYGDLYRDIVYHGGMVIGSFGSIWSSGTTAYYTAPPLDVSSPAGQAAWTDHLTRNDPMLATYLANPYIDSTFTSNSTTPAYTQKLYDDSSALPRIENMHVPTLHLAGWFDAFTRGQLETFRQAYAREREEPGRGPNYLIVGPWNHSGTHFISPDAGFKSRLSDWYRYWLEGKAAGFPAPSWFSEPRVKYFQMTSGIVNAQTPADGAWRSASDWPPPSIGVDQLHLRAGGVLSPTAPAAETPDSYTYNPLSGASETGSRWDNAAGAVPHTQIDQRAETGRVLTYQTDTLSTPIAIDGPIGLKLFASTQGLPDIPSPVASWPGFGQLAPPYHDTDFVVKLSDVAPDGKATLVTQGYLRASHRAYDPARSTVVDGAVLAPYTLHTRAALDPPGTGAREYQIEIWPTARTFGAGHRLRIDISSADTPEHLSLLKPALNTVFHEPGLDSILSLPIIR